MNTEFLEVRIHTEKNASCFMDTKTNRGPRNKDTHTEECFTFLHTKTVKHRVPREAWNYSTLLMTEIKMDT